jgi:hypothetical protein
MKIELDKPEGCLKSKDVEWKRRPTEARRKRKHFQYLTEDIGDPHISRLRR